MSPDHQTPEIPAKSDLLSQTKGLVQSFSEGIRHLLVLDEKLSGIGRESERSRAEITKLQEICFKLLGKIEEMDKRVTDRFAELDKRLAEVDKRIDLKVELAVKNETNRSYEAAVAKPRKKATEATLAKSRKRTARTATPRHTE